LSKVFSFAQLLVKRYGESFDEIGKEYLNFIISGTKKMQLLINDLLEYTRVQQVKEKFEIVDINEVIQQLMLDLQYDIQQQNATIEFSNLPSIYANLRLIKQLFQNLISNAIKFCQIETPIIQIHFEEKGDVWQFSVKDNGIGFKMDEGKRIFEIFQRAVGQGAYQGTGIGLAICKRVVEKHEGKIWVESERLVGSTFYCTISKYLSTKF
jgi:light-regulated signal transduction histidine kinase (bacteriophytochrome)